MAKDIQRGSVKDVFDGYLARTADIPRAGTGVVEEVPQLSINAEDFQKLREAFEALEELLVVVFPDSRMLRQVLTFLEIAAMYVLRLL